jgi:hypothetical protein
MHWSPILPWVSPCLYSLDRRLSQPEVPTSRGMRSLDRGHLRSGSARFPKHAEAGSRADLVPPRGPTVCWTGSRRAVGVGRLRPHAGRRWPRVACSGELGLSSSLAGRSVATGFLDPRAPTASVKHRSRGGGKLSKGLPEGALASGSRRPPGGAGVGRRTSMEHAWPGATGTATNRERRCTF